MVNRRRIALLGALLTLGALAQAQYASVNDTLPTLISNIYPGGNCPTSIQAIRFQYVVPVAAGPVGAIPVISSNWTLEPFSGEPIDIKDLYIEKRKPTIDKTCDSRGRCMEAYEMNAEITVVDLGFTDNNGTSLKTQLLTYDGTFPGKQFNMKQGRQALVRFRNLIHCNTTTWTPINVSTPGYDGAFFSFATSLTLHLHGGAELSPFDGWTADNIEPCMWKDYAYVNYEGGVPYWYHDHAIDETSNTVGCGLEGPYWVETCDPSKIPLNLQPLWPPEYLMYGDNLFVQFEGSPYANPAQLATTLLYPNLIFNGSAYNVTGISGDHNFLNGKPFPVIKVQRRPYLWIFHNAAQTRLLNITMSLTDDPMNGETLNESPMGTFWVVGSDGGLRPSPVPAATGLAVGPGERYMIVVDFSKFEPGTVVYMYNPPDPGSGYPYFCYTHLIAKFVVDGTEERWAPFNPTYAIPMWEDHGEIVTELQMRKACDALMSDGGRNADVRMQANVVPNPKAAETGTPYLKVFSNMPDDPNVFHTGMMGNNMQGGTDVRKSKRRSGRKLKQDAGAPAPAVSVSPYLPHSVATDGWSSWWFWNNGTGPGSGGLHPIHLHLLNFYVCGRRNNDTETSLAAYEFLTPKDVFVLYNNDEVGLIARIGPSQGSYLFHCHNLQHEDGGLMSQFNSTDPVLPHINTTFYKNTLLPGRVKGFEKARARPDGLINLADDDPLVFAEPGNKIIAHDLYYSYSMPPTHQRTDPRHPKQPQPLTKGLLQKVLKRNYYPEFYPDARKGLWQTIPDNKYPYAVFCPKPK